jgi:hypothetical protein
MNAAKTVIVTSLKIPYQTRHCSWLTVPPMPSA